MTQRSAALLKSRFHGLPSEEDLDRNPVLAVRDLWFSYDGSSQILQGVSLELGRGLMTMILGRSGSGKTTLLKIIQGLIPVQRGQVYTPQNGKPFLPRIAYIPQTLGLVRNMTALDNVLVGALGSVGTMRSIFKLFPKKIIENAQTALESVGLKDKMERKAGLLSGGERQRVAIARALMLKPHLILADEFVSQLDPVTTNEILSMMRELAGLGVGFLITTHDTDIVSHYADRVVILRNAQIVYNGTASTLGANEILDLIR